MSHIHSHSCGCAEASKGPGDIHSLYQDINQDQIIVLNEEVTNSGKKVIKPYDQRMDETCTVTSSCDGELLYSIPFTSCVRLKALTVRANSQGQSPPSKMKLWVNRDDIDFSNCEDIKPTQELFIPVDNHGDFLITVKAALFHNTNHLTILFSTPHPNMNSDEISFSYLGFYGQPTNHKRIAINVVYEAKANPKDHKADASADAVFSLGK